ncbi:uncharacterized protein EI90DRAFT_3068008 [Cantharellus anzutake]|uniref:uncharacterized protein n=1 Tax=Cantharellus anzutake TaxID=1750568 RepID=UPI001908DE0D|nr:uncharacterized protein EI90DRAFT_3068008 [Cantharellus anzutake]KAF8327135.1 hypothetical protein EI90DRAFT_3068008 [Cantharellus anzutake]
MHKGPHFPNTYASFLLLPTVFKVRGVTGSATTGGRSRFETLGVTPITIISLMRLDPWIDISPKELCTSKSLGRPGSNPQRHLWPQASIGISTKTHRTSKDLDPHH